MLLCILLSMLLSMLLCMLSSMLLRILSCIVFVHAGVYAVKYVVCACCGGGPTLGTFQCHSVSSALGQSRAQPF
jgi:hypothetical protein